MAHLSILIIQCFKQSLLYFVFAVNWLKLQQRLNMGYNRYLLFASMSIGI